MKRVLLGAAIVTALTGCGSLGLGNTTGGMTPPSDTATPVKDTKISTEFADQGIKIYYTLMGNIDRIEVYGQAPSWKGNHEIIAEADAKEKLVKFVHGENVSTERRIKVIGKAIEKARDNTVNKFKSADGTINFDSQQLESEGGTQDNTSRRIADRVDTTLVNAVTTITSRGRLTGLRKIRDSVVQDGRVYVAVYQWSEKDQATSEFIRNRMR